MKHSTAAAKKVKTGLFDDNRILQRLAEPERQRLGEHLQEVPLPLGARLEDATQQAKRLYFPTSGIVSLVKFMENGATGELAIVGKEGLVGTPIFLSGRSSSCEAVVQVRGRALTLPAAIVREEFDRNEQFRGLLLEYAQALTEQIAQTALCNRHHRIDQQLARWLLMSLDRLSSSDVTMTQDLIANMLGVRREGVSGAANTLQRDGIIFYRRGKIKVLDRDALEARSCECYGNVTDHYQHIGIQ